MRAMKRFLWRLMAGCLVAGASLSSVEAGNKRAVVIGVNDYAAETKLADLKFATNDAASMARILQQSGYRSEDIRVLTTDATSPTNRPTKNNIVAALKEAAQGDQVQADDSLMVVFAGHGFNASGESYLCPADFSDGHTNESAVRVAELANLLASSRAGEKYVVIDACRNDRSEKTARDFNLLTGLKKMRLNDDDATSMGTAKRGGRGIVFFSSCLPGQQSFEDERLGDGKGAGVFLHFFGQGLLGEADYDGGNHDGRVSAAEAIEYASAKTSHHVQVRFDAPQLPWNDSHSTANLSLTELSAETREKMFAKFGHRIEDGLKRVERKQAEAKLDAALGALAGGNNAVTIKLVSEAIESDSSYYMARRLRSVLHLIEGNNAPHTAFANYSHAVEDMRAVGGVLRITLAQPIWLQDGDLVQKFVMPAASVIVVDEMKRFGGYEWAHVTGWIDGNAPRYGSSEAQSVDGYVCLAYVATPAANRAQVEGFNRAQGGSVTMPTPVNGVAADGTKWDRIQDGLTITSGVLTRIPQTSQAGSVVGQVNGYIGVGRAFLGR
ncbi:MAG: caspase domain-containing protein [Planctomycetota bacterium]